MIVKAASSTQESIRSGLALMVITHIVDDVSGHGRVSKALGAMFRVESRATSDELHNAPGAIDLGRHGRDTGKVQQLALDHDEH
jgi:hypothetical protein